MKEIAICVSAMGIQNTTEIEKGNDSFLYKLTLICLPHHKNMMHCRYVYICSQVFALICKRGTGIGLIEADLFTNEAMYVLKILSSRFLSFPNIPFAFLFIFMLFHGE